MSRGVHPGPVRPRRLTWHPSGPSCRDPRLGPRLPAREGAPAKTILGRECLTGTRGGTAPPASASETSSVKGLFVFCDQPPDGPVRDSPSVCVCVDVRRCVSVCVRVGVCALARTHVCTCLQRRHASIRCLRPRECGYRCVRVRVPRVCTSGRGYECPVRSVRRQM